MTPLLTLRLLAGCLGTGFAAWLLHSRSVLNLGVFVPLGVPVLVVALCAHLGWRVSVPLTVGSCLVSAFLVEATECYVTFAMGPDSIGLAFEMLIDEWTFASNYPYRVALRHGAYFFVFAALSIEAAAGRRTRTALCRVALFGVVAPALVLSRASAALVSSGLLEPSMPDVRTVIDPWGVYKWGLGVSLCALGVAGVWFATDNSPGTRVPEIV